MDHDSCVCVLTCNYDQIIALIRAKPDNVLHEEIGQNELYDGDQCPSVHKQCRHH